MVLAELFGLSEDGVVTTLDPGMPGAREVEIAREKLPQIERSPWEDFFGADPTVCNKTHVEGNAGDYISLRDASEIPSAYSAFKAKVTSLGVNFSDLLLEMAKVEGLGPQFLASIPPIAIINHVANTGGKIVPIGKTIPVNNLVAKRLRKVPLKVVNENLVLVVDQNQVTFHDPGYGADVTVFAYKE